MADERTRLPVKLVDPTTAANQAGVDAGGNLQVILAASTNNIGDVDVLSVIPGVGVTNLGKAEDQLSANADVGVAAMVVQDAVLTALTSGDLDYTNLRVNANGALWTQDVGVDAALAGSELQVDVVAALPTGANTIGSIADITTSVTPGTAAANLGKAENVPSAGADTGVAAFAVQDAVLSALTSVDGDYTWLRTDANGALHVTGAGGGTQFAVDDPLGATPTGTLALARRDDVLGALTPVADDAVALRVDANGALWTHDDALDAALAGSELQVDIVAPLPTGTNEIGDIGSINTNVVPGVAATSLGKAIDSVVGATDTGVAILAERIDTPAAITPAIGDYSGLFVDVNGRLHVTDPNAGAGTPGTPTNVEANSTNTAPDGTFDVDSADFGVDTKRVSYATAGSSVNFKAELNFVDDGTPTTLATMFGQGPGAVVFRPGHKDYWEHTFAANAGFDGFRLTITNLDTSESADLYGTINHED